MKYTASNPPLKCFMTQSTWYKSVGPAPVRGVLWHSTGANNPTVARYVQPDDNAPDRAELLNIIGKNPYGNDWNHIYVEAGVHAFIGKLANGEVAAVQTGEWDKKAWGCGPGTRGSCNNGWIQFEICEDALKDPAYFEKIYREGVELTAYLCKLYGLDPHGTVQYCGMTVPIILCHKDSARLGLGSDHGDVLHWFPKYGKSMETVRNDVAALLAEQEKKEEKENMPRYNTMDEIEKGASFAVETVRKLIDRGIIVGGGKKDANNDPADMELTHDMLRLLCFMDRAGAFDN